MGSIFKIVDVFEETIKEGELQTITKEITETLIDGTLDDGLLKDLPLIGSFFGLIKASANIKDRLFTKKILAFLSNLENIDDAKKVKIINEINTSGKYKTKIGEKLLYIIDKCYDAEKAEIVAKLFNGFLKKEINYDDFLRASECLDKVFIPDLLYFIDDRKSEYDVNIKEESLIFAGLIKLEQIAPSLDKKSGEIEDSELSYKITRIGSLVRKLVSTKPFRKYASLF